MGQRGDFKCASQVGTLRAPVQQFQPLKGEEGFHFLYGAGFCRNDRGQSPGRDDSCALAKLPLNPLHHAVHQTCIAEDQSRLHATHGVMPDGRFGSNQLDLGQLGSPRGQGIRRNGKAGRDGSTEIFARSGDRAECRCGTEVYDDESRLVLSLGRSGVHETITPDLVWVFVFQGETRVELS